MSPDSTPGLVFPLAERHGIEERTVQQPQCVVVQLGYQVAARHSAWSLDATEPIQPRVVFGRVRLAIFYSSIAAVAHGVNLSRIAKPRDGVAECRIKINQLDLSCRTIHEYFKIRP